MFQFVHTNVILDVKPFANRNGVQLCLTPSIISEKIGSQFILFLKIDILETVLVAFEVLNDGGH